MTRHDDTLYVALMRDEVRGVLEAVEGRSREEFITDELRIGSAAFHFMRLAERPLKASAAFRAAHREIPWEDLAGIRDRVEPELFQEDAAVMWEIATGEFPALVDALEALLPPDELWRYRKDDDSDEELAWPASEPDVSPRVPMPMAALDEICRRYDVRRIRFCGSVLRDDFGPESDVDLLVEFEPGHTPGMMGVSRLQRALEVLLGGGRSVDLRTYGDLSRYFRDEVRATARPVFDAAA